MSLAGDASVAKGSTPGVAFFDLDKTLLDCNSGTLWLRAEWAAGRLTLRDLAWATYWLGRYSLGIGRGLEKVFEAAVQTLAGSEEAQMVARTDAWFDSLVAHRVRPGGVAALDQHREAGERCVLATSGSWYAALAAGKVFGLDDVVATQFEVQEGRFTGRISSMAYGSAKRDRVMEWADAEEVDLADCAFYTDSLTDLALLEVVGRPVVVNPDLPLARIARQRGWPIVDWGTSG